MTLFRLLLIALVVLVGSPKALKVALRNNRPRERRTMLAYHLNPGAVETN